MFLLSLFAATALSSAAPCAHFTDPQARARCEKLASSFESNDQPLEEKRQTSVQPAKNCLEQKQRGVTTDGEYTLTSNGLPIYCFNMSGTPKEYITLPLSAGGNNTAVNFAEYRTQNSAAGDKYLKSHYFKLRLDLPTLSVDTADDTFAKHWLEIPGDGVGPVDVTLGLPAAAASRNNVIREPGGLANQVNASAAVAKVNYGSALSCNNCTSSPAYGNIDLTGTRFFVNDTFFLVPRNPYGTVSIPADKGSQVINLQGGGNCGGLSVDPQGMPVNKYLLGSFRLQLRVAPPPPPTPPPTPVPTPVPTPNPPPPAPPGVCCFNATNTCQAFGQAQCQSYLGLFIAGATCPMGGGCPPIPSTGSCCVKAPSGGEYCLDARTPLQCASDASAVSGTAAWGAGLTCGTGGACPGSSQTGACRAGSNCGLCVNQASGLSCANVGGTYFGDGSTCAANCV